MSFGPQRKRTEGVLGGCHGLEASIGWMAIELLMSREFTVRLPSRIAPIQVSPNSHSMRPSFKSTVPATSPPVHPSVREKTAFHRSSITPFESSAAGTDLTTVKTVATKNSNTVLFPSECVGRGRAQRSVLQSVIGRSSEFTNILVTVLQ